jgi:hypothetical protein
LIKRFDLQTECQEISGDSESFQHESKEMHANKSCKSKFLDLLQKREHGCTKCLSSRRTTLIFRAECARVPIHRCISLEGSWLVRNSRAHTPLKRGGILISERKFLALSRYLKMAAGLNRHHVVEGIQAADRKLKSTLLNGRDMTKPKR